MDTVEVCLLQLACVALRHKNLNQSLADPRDLHDWRTADTRHDLTGAGGRAEANLCLEAVKRMTVNANDAEHMCARRRSTLRLQVASAA